MGTWRGAAGCGPVVALLSLGEVVLSLAAGGVLTARAPARPQPPPLTPPPQLTPLPRPSPLPMQTWSPGNLEAPLRSCRLPAGFEPTCLCHPDAYLNKVLVGAADGRLALLNFATSRLVHVFAGVPAGSGDGADGRRQPGVTCLAAAPALDTVGVGLSDGRWALLNVAYDATLAVFTHGDGGCGGGDEGGEGSAVTALAFRTGAGPPQAVAGGAGGALSVWDLEARRLAAVVPGAHDARVRSSRRGGGGGPLFVRRFSPFSRRRASRPFSFSPGRGAVRTIDRATRARAGPTHI